MFERFKKAFSKKGNSWRYDPQQRPRPEMPKQDRMKTRRWDSAETNRLNEKTWGKVGNAQTINRDLYEQRSTLVARCRHERYNNPMLEGLCETYSIDVIGGGGPSLVVESESEEYNKALKDLWSDFWHASNMEVSGLTGNQLLQRLIIQDFTDGDWCQQFVDLSNELPGDSVVNFRLLDIDPERLKTPFHLAGDYYTALGIKRDRLGRAVQYFVAEPSDQFANWDQSLYSHEHIALTPSEFLHNFYSREPAQVRGFPRFASILQEMADLRDFDAQVLDAARAAANNSFLLWTEIPEMVDGMEAFTGTIDLERQTAKAIPPGYKATQMNPANPAANYVEYRHERMRAAGRIIHMPLLAVLLSAEDSNFSQSRIDLNVMYERGLNQYRQQRVVPWLNRLVREVEKEGRLATDVGGQFVLPPRPNRVSFSFYFDPIGQANPKDYVAAQDVRLRLGLTTYERELAKENLREDDVIQSRKRTNDKLKAAGLDPLPGTKDVENSKAKQQTEESKENATNETKEIDA